MNKIIGVRTLKLIVNECVIADGLYKADSIDKFYGFEELVRDGFAKRVGCNEYEVCDIENLYNQNKRLIDEAIQSKKINREIKDYERKRLVESVLKRGNGLKSDFVRRYIYNRDNGICVYCRIELPGDFHIDHIYPKSKGGKDILENLALSCPTCNLKKGAKIINNLE